MRAVREMQSPEWLVNEFSKCVAAQTDLLAEPNRKTGNRFAKRYFAAFQELRAHGDAGRDALARLLDHERTDVRVMAAAFLLRHAHARARLVLEAASEEQSLAGFGASQTLKRWDAGGWALDPE